MSDVTLTPVVADEAGLRLDRWFRRRFPDLTHGRLEKLLRTGQIRVDGHRAQAGQRLEPGQTVRVPPLPPPPAETENRRPTAPPPPSERDAAALRAMVLYRDDDVIAINKPPGLAVQGGTGTTRHLDGMLDALRFGAPERPRLVHRLDRDTSGVLLLARHAAAAAELAAAFKDRAARKVYWALVAGVPKTSEGRVSAPLAKVPGRAGERMMVDEDEGRPAVTEWRILNAAGGRVAWLELRPLTGRTHQLRAHCALLGTPIVGDGKYGGAAAQVPGADLSRQLHLHARLIELPRRGQGVLRVVAPLPPHMVDSVRFFGFPER
ncbi:MAG: RluA family pseudouridine synthase [Alphaproteobacteria bacterium]